MNASFQFDVSVLTGIPPKPWSSGRLQLEYQVNESTGTLVIAKYNDAFSLAGSVQFDVQNGARVILKGENSAASVEIYGVQMTNDFDGHGYFAGMLNLLDNEVQEWIPYIIICYGAVGD